MSCVCFGAICPFICALNHHILSTRAAQEENIYRNTTKILPSNAIHLHCISSKSKIYMCPCCNWSGCDISLLDRHLFAADPDGSLCLSLAMRGPVVSICTLTPTHAHIHTNTHTHTQLSQPETSKLCKFLLWWCAGCGPLSRSHTHKLFSGVRYRWGKAFCVCVCCMWIVLNWKEFTDNSAWTLHRHGQCCMWRISISSSGTGTNPQFVCSAITWQQSCHWYDL